MGEGTFDNLHQIRALLKSGYKENFTLETHAKHPDGKAAATRKSLSALLRSRQTGLTQLRLTVATHGCVSGCHRIEDAQEVRPAAQ